MEAIVFMKSGKKQEFIRSGQPDKKSETNRNYRFNTGIYIFNKKSPAGLIVKNLGDSFLPGKLFEMNFSVVINTYNAGKHLREVLSSVKDADEIVICDMHSTDDTLAIAGEFDCRVVYYEKNGREVGICEPARNLAIQSAKNDWVLLIDADEKVTGELLEFCNEHIRKSNPEPGVFIPRKNYLHGIFMHASYPDYIMRFFKKEACYWPPHQHAVPRIDGPVIKIPKKKKNLAIIHLDDQTIHERIEKLNRYAGNDVKRMLETGRQFGYFSMFFRFWFYFIRFYFIKGGIRDGKAGLVYSILYSFYRFVIMAKLWETQLKRGNEKT